MRARRSTGHRSRDLDCMRHQGRSEGPSTVERLVSECEEEAEGRRRGVSSSADRRAAAANVHSKPEFRPIFGRAPHSISKARVNLRTENRRMPPSTGQHSLQPDTQQAAAQQHARGHPACRLGRHRGYPGIIELCIAGYMKQKRSVLGCFEDDDRMSEAVAGDCRQARLGFLA